MSLYREYITANVVLERKPKFYHFCQKKKEKGNQTTTLIIFLNQNLRFGSRTVSWKERIISIIKDYPIFPPYIPQIVSKDFNSDCQNYRIGIRNKSCKQNTPRISIKILKEKNQSSIFAK